MGRFNARAQKDSAMARSGQKNLLPLDALTGPLHEIYALVGKHPLHKLIPSGLYGSPAFAANGTFISNDEGKHLSVTLGVGYDGLSKKWTCRITIMDADDLIHAYWRPFVLEEWNKALTIYHALYMYDPELITEFC